MQFLRRGTLRSGWLDDCGARSWQTEHMMPSGSRCSRRGPKGEIRRLKSLIYPSSAWSVIFPVTHEHRFPGSTDLHAELLRTCSMERYQRVSGNRTSVTERTDLFWWHLDAGKQQISQSSFINFYYYQRSLKELLNPPKPATDAMYSVRQSLSVCESDDAPDHEKHFSGTAKPSATAYRGYDFRRVCIRGLGGKVHLRFQS